MWDRSARDDGGSQVLQMLKMFVYGMGEHVGDADRTRPEVEPGRYKVDQSERRRERRPVHPRHHDEGRDRVPSRGATRCRHRGGTTDVRLPSLGDGVDAAGCGHGTDAIAVPRGIA